MALTALYLFTYSSWGLGLFAAFMALAMKFQEHTEKIKLIRIESESRSVEIAGKRGLANLLTSRPAKIPEELQKLMDRSAGHPEVDEIEPGDEVFGVLFKGKDYPPNMENQEVDEE